MRYQISKLNDIEANYACALTMERINYEHEVSYINQMLVIKDTAFLQAEQIKQIFLECYTFMQKNKIKLVKVDNPIGKSIKYNGSWYTSDNFSNFGFNDKKETIYETLPELIIEYDEDNKSTTYKYGDVDIITVFGEASKEYSQHIYDNYIKGKYFTQLTSNILRNYPNYVVFRDSKQEIFN